MVATISGQAKAVQAWKKASTPSAPSAPRSSGRTMRKKIHNSPAPSMRAASISSSGIEWMTFWRIRKMPKLITR